MTRQLRLCHCGRRKKNPSTRTENCVVAFLFFVKIASTCIKRAKFYLCASWEMWCLNFQFSNKDFASLSDDDFPDSVECRNKTLVWARRKAIKNIKQQQNNFLVWFKKISHQSKFWFWMQIRRAVKRVEFLVTFLLHGYGLSVLDAVSKLRRHKSREREQSWEQWRIRCETCCWNIDKFSIPGRTTHIQ